MEGGLKDIRGRGRMQELEGCDEGGGRVEDLVVNISDGSLSVEGKEGPGFLSLAQQLSGISPPPGAPLDILPLLCIGRRDF